MKNFVCSVFCCFALLCSCSTQEFGSETSNVLKENVVNVQPITAAQTRSEVLDGGLQYGYLCTSETSSLRLEVFPSSDNLETLCYMIDSDGEIQRLIYVKVDSYIADGVCRFTMLNEIDEPIASGIYDTLNKQIEVTDIYGNDAITRASAKAWACNMAIGVAGGIWSTAAGMASAGAGFVVGLAYTALAVQVCDGL